MLRKLNYFISSLLLIGLFLAIACKSKKSENTDSWDKRNTRNLDITDTAYLNAVNTAKNTVDFFTKLLSDKEQNHFDFFIKTRFSENSITEHMWFNAIELKNDSFIAILDNVPTNLKKIKYRDTVHIAKKDIEDWSIYEADSILLGNFISHANDK